MRSFGDISQEMTHLASLLEYIECRLQHFEVDGHAGEQASTLNLAALLASTLFKAPMIFPILKRYRDRKAAPTRHDEPSAVPFGGLASGLSGRWPPPVQANSFQFSGAL